MTKEFQMTGRVDWIGIRPERGAAVTTVESVEVLPGRGLSGDHRAARKKPGRREVTLIQSEHLEVVSRLLGGRAVTAAQTRRNVAISGINLVSLIGREFRVGNVVLKGTGPCEPCRLMEIVLGPGGLQAMHGHGGITVKIVRGGAIHIGDVVEFAEQSEHTAQSRANSPGGSGGMHDRPEGEM